MLSLLPLKRHWLDHSAGLVMKILVTAGPTREPLDPIRFLSNRSSGRMGFEISRALLAAGHEVILVHGPVSLKVPSGVEAVAVETARQMLAACRRHWPSCEGMVAVAAVADFRPAKTETQKIKKGKAKEAKLILTANPDIVATLAAKKGSRVVVGFALETKGGKKEAMRKMTGKNLDLVVLNGPANQGASTAQWTVFCKDGSQESWGPSAKKTLARRLVRKAFSAILE